MDKDDVIRMETKKLPCDDEIGTTMARRRFVEAAMRVADHWAKAGKNVEDAAEGTLFSLLAMMDGCDNGYDGCSVITSDGKQISGVLHEVLCDMGGEKKENPPTLEKKDGARDAEGGMPGHGRFHETPPRLPDGLRLMSCAECGGLHRPDDRCIMCNAPVFDRDQYCWRCGQNLCELDEKADGYCSCCGHPLFSGTALNPMFKDYRCPGCSMGADDGVTFKFKTPELRAAYFDALENEERAQRSCGRDTSKDECGCGEDDA